MKKLKIKVCGITREEDAQYCADLGVDALGFIFHTSSPRNLSVQQFIKLEKKINFGNCLKVAVAVCPDLLLVKQLLDAGFNKFQFHFPADVPIRKIEEWTKLVGFENLWLAPRLKNPENFQDKHLKFAQTILIDGYSDEAYGGTGQLADWSKLAQFKGQFSDHRWYLAGGLGPHNLEDAIAVANPDGVDLNSGVESMPGLKDLNKIDQVFELLP